MNENMIFEESENISKQQEDIIEEVAKKTSSRRKNKNENDIKKKECKVINFDKKNGYLDILFDDYGVRISDIKDFNDDIAIVKYTGEIGKPNFSCRL